MSSTNPTNPVETVVIDFPSLQMLCSHAGPILLAFCDFAVWFHVTKIYQTAWCCLCRDVGGCLYLLPSLRTRL